MVGAHDSTVSPSSSSTSRNTPCVLGCCGPMLTVIVSARMSATRQPILHDVLAEFFFGHLQRLRGVRSLANLHRIILAQRKAVPVFGHQQTARVGVAVK